MTSAELENLVRVGTLKREAPSPSEFAAMLRSGSAKLRDAANTTLAIESRFDLAYNGVHALALAALRSHGYRSENRYTVFQALPHTLGISGATLRVLIKAHTQRNHAEYEGAAVDDVQLVNGLIEAGRLVEHAVNALARKRDAARD